MESRDEIHAKRLHCQLVPGPGDDIIWGGMIEGGESELGNINND